MSTMNLLILKAFDAMGRCVQTVSATPDCGVVYVRLWTSVPVSRSDSGMRNEIQHTHAVESKTLIGYRDGKRFNLPDVIWGIGIGSGPSTVRMVQGNSYQFVPSFAENMDEMVSDFVASVPGCL